VGDSWVGKNPPGFVWSSIGVRIGLVDFHQIATLKPRLKTPLFNIAITENNTAIQ
jgi:hypothetical protein